MLTWVERNFGFAVAQAYAGHEGHGRSARTMATYIRAGLPEAAALAVLTGEQNPLAVSPDLTAGNLQRPQSQELTIPAQPQPR